ncbi:aldehyde dehydrogenase (NADP(+)) [Rhodococcus koreensis]
MTTPTNAQELDAVLASASEAFRSWSARNPAERAADLDAIADALEEAGPTLVPLAAQETALGTPRLTGELTRTAFQLRLLGQEIRSGGFLDATVDHADPSYPMGARPDIRRISRPLGPALVFAASNFPFAFSVAGGDSASALAAGCPVVLKTHSGHPGLSVEVGRIVTETLLGRGAPDGVFALIHGTEAGTSAITDPRIKVAAFTGSTEVGRILFDLAVSRPEPIPFFGELGSVNPVFVTEAAATKRGAEIVTGFAGSFTLGSGQFCTKPGVLCVPAGSSIVDDLPAAVPTTSLPMLNDRIRTGYSAALADLEAVDGVDALVGGADESSAVGPRPSVLRTTSAAVLADPSIVAREVFGPTSLIVEYTDEAELVLIAGVMEGQLTATIHAEDDDAVAVELLEAAADRAGRVLWNQWPTGVTVSAAQVHGGPYPATTAPGTTSVGTAAIDRFMRPVAYQNVPSHLLPEQVRDDNPLGVPQRVS